ncbi:MAG: hypothetical protein HY909_19770 [Deltaproteobacteria bacterium]|nr:hypothetical protein [Deltaproteobacteria bacterium]
MRSAALGAFLAVAAWAPAARCDRRPTVASDGFYIGARVGPGTAFTGAWDLDVYLTRNRLLSIGPAVSLNILGRNAPAGQEQELVVSGDMRLKIGLNEPGGIFRPFVMLGGGFTYAELLETRQAGVSVTPPGSLMSVQGEVLHPRLRQWSPMLTLGAGMDLFALGAVGFTTAFQTRFHLGGSDRLPDAWFELLFGVRFGL